MKWLKKIDAVEGAILGLGVVTVAAVLIKGSRASAKTRSNPVTAEDELYYASTTPRMSNFPEALEITSEDLSKADARFPSIAMKFNGPSNPVEIYALNYTPRKMSTEHDERLYNDIAQFANLEDVPVGFEEYPDPEHMIHPYDYQHLQQLGIIPLDFDVRRIQYTKSLNGENEFIVGYSEPKFVNVGRGKNCPYREAQPLWAVSVGKNFNSASNPPTDINDLDEFYEAAMRMLASEWMLTNRGTHGCVPGTDRFQCDLERAGLVGILLQRQRLRQRKKHNRGRKVSYEEIAYKSGGHTWNRGTTYRVAYNGYPGAKDAAAEKYKDSRYRRAYTDSKIPRRFEEYKRSYMWHLPLLAGVGATNFGHVKSLNHVPSFLQHSVRAHKNDVDGFANRSNVRIGASVLSNHGKTFK